ncbi:MAG: MBL fold metallo-hydrolase [Myxococcota bacterium]
MFGTFWSQPRSREALRGWVLGATALVAACSSGPDLAGVAPPDAVPERVRFEVADDLDLYALQTGWVGIKEPHWRYQAPGFLVVPRIFLSGDWHPWLPNLAYAVKTPKGVVLFDTGADPKINDDDYFACDPNSEVFYRRNLRFVVPEDGDLGARLQAIAVPPDDVTDVVISHFHADHTGRLALFPAARLWTGAGNWVPGAAGPEHVGAVPCTLPPGLEARAPVFEDGPFGAFEASHVLLGDPRVRIVPLGGHTPGHVGLLVSDGDRYWLVAGDATFDRAETDAGHVAGVSEDVEAARASQARIRDQLARFDTTLLPAHDLAVLLPAGTPDH